MTPQPLQHRLAPTIVPVAWVGIAVLAIAAWLGGGAGATAAMVAILVGVLIAVLAEASASVLGLSRPLDRMLFTMLIRGGLSMVAIVTAIVGMGIDAKLVVLVAAPIYAALLLGEAAAALSANKSTEAASFETDAFQGRA